MDASAGSTRDLVIALVLATVAQALVSMAIFAPAVLAPAAQADVGVGASTVGIFISIVFVAAALAAPLGGAQVVRHGPVRVSQYCLLWAAAGIGLFATASPLIMVCAALAMGIGYGPVTPASSAMLASRSPDRLRNMIMSIRQSGVTLGGVLAGAVLPGLTLAYGWRVSSIVVAAACLIFAAVLQLVRERYDTERTGLRHPEHSSYRMLMRVVFKHPELRQVALTSFTYSGVQMCCGSFLVVFLMQRVGMGYIEAGVIYSSAMIGGVVGRPLWGVLADYFGRARTFLGILGVLMWLSATTVAQITAQWPYPAVLVVCSIFGISAFGWNGIYIAEVARIAPGGNVALATGAAIVFTFLGIVIVPVLFWLVITLGGTFSAAFMLIGTIALAGGLLFFRKPATRT